MNEYKLSILLTRKLNSDYESIFYNRIINKPIKNIINDKVSNKVIYDNILNLILEQGILRKYYIDENHLLIYTIIKNFFNAVSETYEEQINESTIINSFNKLNKILTTELETEKNISKEFFKQKIHEEIN